MKRLVVDYKKLQKATHRKQYAVAGKMGISSGYISKLINNKMERTPSLDVLNDICEAIGMDTLGFLQHVETERWKPIEKVDNVILRKLS